MVQSSSAAALDEFIGQAIFTGVDAGILMVLRDNGYQGPMLTFYCFIVTAILFVIWQVKDPATGRPFEGPDGAAPTEGRIDWYNAATLLPRMVTNLVTGLIAFTLYTFLLTYLGVKEGTLAEMQAAADSSKTAKFGINYLGCYIVIASMRLIGHILAIFFVIADFLSALLTGRGLK